MGIQVKQQRRVHKLGHRDTYGAAIEVSLCLRGQNPGANRLKMTEDNNFVSCDRCQRIIMVQEGVDYKR